MEEIRSTFVMVRYKLKVDRLPANQSLLLTAGTRSFQHSLCLVSSVGISPPDREAGGIPRNQAIPFQCLYFSKAGKGWFLPKPSRTRAHVGRFLDSCARVSARIGRNVRASQALVHFSKRFLSLIYSLEKCPGEPWRRDARTYLSFSWRLDPFIHGCFLDGFSVDKGMISAVRE